MNSFFNIVITLFIVANPLGNAPAIASMIKDFDLEKQKAIMIRETFAALCLAIFFQYFATPFLQLLQVSDYSVSLCGGILLLYAALTMIFPETQPDTLSQTKKEPFIVPIATPLISGPGLLTMIMIFSHKDPSPLKITFAILTTWIGVSSILLLAPYLQKVLGKRGLTALEKLMGMIVTMISVQLIVQGVQQFMGIL